MRVGESIVKIRKERNLSQEKFAEKLGVSRQTISNWENEKSYPDLGMMVFMSNEFHISLDQFLKEDKKIVNTIDKKLKYNKILKITLLIVVLLLVALLVNVFVLKYQDNQKQKQNTERYNQIMGQLKILGFKKGIDLPPGFNSLNENNITYQLYTKMPEIIKEPSILSAITHLEGATILLDYKGEEKVSVTYIEKSVTTIYCNKTGDLLNDKQNKETIKIYEAYKEITIEMVKRSVELHEEIYK